MIKVKMFKAGPGDSILVSLGDIYNTNILIDMGYDSTYKNYIKPELEKLRGIGEKIDLLVITHVDEDHILGALEFIKDNGKYRSVIDVNEVWHNTYRHLYCDNDLISELSKKDEEKIKRIINSNLPALSEENRTDGISVKQGISLGAYLVRYGYRWNESFNNKAVKCTDTEIYMKLNDEVKLIILSPDNNKLDKLQKRWERDLKVIFNIDKVSCQEFFDDAFEFYMQYLQEEDSEVSNITNSSVSERKIETWSNKEERDGSVTNGASISFIIEFGGKKLLFLGDAHQDIIYEKLNQLHKNGYTLSFNLIKIAHHGSNKNISNKLVNLIDGEKFMFSTDGENYHHPDLECISKIIKKPTKYKKELIFNYRIDKVEKFICTDFEKKYNYSIIFLDDNESIVIK